MKSILRIPFLQVIILSALFLACSFSVHAQLHTIAIGKSVSGPGGTNAVHVGEQVTAILTFANVDPFFDTWTVESTFDVVFHASGTVTNGGNLLTTTTNFVVPGCGNTVNTRVVLPFGATLQVTNTYTVLPGDETLPGGFLQDRAIWIATDLHNGAGGTCVPQTVPESFDNHITILATPPPSTNTNFCVIRAVSDPIYNPGGSDHAVWLPGISTNLIFFPQPGSFTEFPDGTATLTGQVRSLTNLNSGFNIDVHLTGFTTTLPPGEFPKEDLNKNAYIQNGGPVDPSTWHYYTNFTGTFTGFGIYSNAVLSIQSTNSTNAAFQVGIGANQKNVNFGASGWFVWTVLQQPVHGFFPVTGRGDFNVDFIVCVPATLGDFVFDDLNANGIQDPGEPGIPNVEVRLTDCTSKLPVLDVTHTDANGLYSFNNLIATNYRVQVIVPTGFTFTSANAGGNDLLDSDFATNGLSPCITLHTNETNTTIDAGLVMFCPTCTLRYPFSSTNPLTSLAFEENSMIRASSANPLGANDTIKVWYNDETALMLGVREVVVKTSGGSVTNDYFVSPLGTVPDAVFHPSVGTTDLTGDQAGTDPQVRPMFPALFITDITTNGASLSGDWQFGGTPIPPSAVYGTWKSSVRIVDQTKSPATVKLIGDADPAQNHWNLDGGDPAPSGLTDQGYGAEIVWNVSDLNLTPGHTYRAQFMVHDGDPESGVEAGQGCVTICIPGSFPIRPLILSVNGTATKKLFIKAELNRNYSIECSQDLATWKSIATVFNSNNVLQFNDNSTGKCFYRIKMLP